MQTFQDRTALMAALPKGSIGAEVGVEVGGFSEVILREVRPRKLYLIDCWEQQDSQVYRDSLNQETRAQEDKWRAVLQRFKHHKEVIVERCYSTLAAEKFEDGYFDWVYIDANHGYESVIADLRAWWPKIRSGGVLLGHDWVDPLQCPFVDMGVIKAVTEFLLHNQLELSYMTEESYPSWGITKP